MKLIQTCYTILWTVLDYYPSNHKYIWYLFAMLNYMFFNLFWLFDIFIFQQPRNAQHPLICENDPSWFLFLLRHKPFSNYFLFSLFSYISISKSNLSVSVSVSVTFFPSVSVCSLCLCCLSLLSCCLSLMVSMSVCLSLLSVSACFCFCLYLCLSVLAFSKKAFLSSNCCSAVCPWLVLWSLWQSHSAELS